MPWCSIAVESEGYQQEQPPALPSVCAALDVVFRLISTKSSCFADDKASIPGNAAAIFRNNACLASMPWTSDHSNLLYRYGFHSLHEEHNYYFPTHSLQNWWQKNHLKTYKFLWKNCDPDIALISCEEHHDGLTLMLNPALALVSMNITPNSRALASPSSMETCLSRWYPHINIS